MYRETKSEAAKRIYGDNATFDCALPQDWVNQWADQGIDVRPHFVMLYPPENCFGVFAPITETGQKIKADHMQNYP